MYVRLPRAANSKPTHRQSTIELEFYKPKAENERPVFKLSCPKMERYMKTAIKAEVEKLKEAFNRSWLILAG
ncbi:MAG TPA: hypothetical protein GXX19_09080 [Syntrophomonadaceae bacterium]|nr:hypothetical protein [Syntrophomonadaceae bacterium]